MPVYSNSAGMIPLFSKPSRNGLLHARKGNCLERVTKNCHGSRGSSGEKERDRERVRERERVRKTKIDREVKRERKRVRERERVRKTKIDRVVKRVRQTKNRQKGREIESQRWTDRQNNRGWT